MQSKAAQAAVKPLEPQLPAFPWLVFTAFITTVEPKATNRFRRDNLLGFTQHDQCDQCVYLIRIIGYQPLFRQVMQ